MVVKPYAKIVVVAKKENKKEKNEEHDSITVMESITNALENKIKFLIHQWSIAILGEEATNYAMEWMVAYKG